MSFLGEICLVGKEAYDMLGTFLIFFMRFLSAEKNFQTNKFFKKKFVSPDCEFTDCSCGKILQNKTFMLLYLLDMIVVQTSFQVQINFENVLLRM